MNLLEGSQFLSMLLVLAQRGLVLQVCFDMVMQLRIKDVVCLILIHRSGSGLCCFIVMEVFWTVL